MANRLIVPFALGALAGTVGGAGVAYGLGRVQRKRAARQRLGTREVRRRAAVNALAAGPGGLLYSLGKYGSRATAGNRRARNAAIFGLPGYALTREDIGRRGAARLGKGGTGGAAAA
jgi:hypothetical protein